MPVRLERVEDGRIAVVVLSRPEKRNALTMEMWGELAEAVESACGDPQVRVVMLRGEGGAFSAGDDIGEMLSLNGPLEARRFFDAVERGLRSILECPKPVIAVVEGPAVGGGAEILLAADLAIASRDSVIGFPEARIGLIPPVLATLGVVVLGHRRARALALTGALLGAEEARELGIVSLVADPGRAWSVALEVAEMIMKSPPEALAEAKRLALKAASCQLGLMGEARRVLERLVLTGEAKERMRAFLEKRLD